MATPVEERKQPADRAVARRPAHEFDAIVLVSFGGPEEPDDVMPFLENVTRGRNVPRERLLEVARHYDAFGGVSPINAQNRALIAALEPELRRHGIDLPIYFGNRNWHPYLADTMRQMAERRRRTCARGLHVGVQLLLGLPPVPRGYLNAHRPSGRTRPGARQIRDVLQPSGFVAANVDRVRAALRELGATRRAHRVHGALIPWRWRRTARTRRNCGDGRLVADAVGVARLAGSSTRAAAAAARPWLEPDIGDHLRALHARGVKRS